MSIFALLLPVPAHGDLPTGAILAWSAPAECPQADEFRADVERFLRQSLDLHRDQRLAITGVVRGSDATGFKGTLRVRGPHGTQRRELSHENCRELTEAAALVTALAIDPELAAVRATAEPSPATPAAAPSEAASASSSASAAPPPASAPPPPVAPPPTPAPTLRSPRLDAPERRTRDWASSVVLLGLAETGALPGGGLGLGARAAAGTSRMQVAANVAYFLPRFVAAQGNSGIDVDLWQVGLKGCGVQALGGFALSGCLGPEFGDLRGQGTGLEGEGTRHARWSALGAELTLNQTTSSGLVTLLGLNLEKSLEEPRFGISKNGAETSLFRPTAWAFQAFFGLGLFR